MEMSQTLCVLGDFERAERVLDEFDGDLGNADPYARARIHWSLARLATARDDRALALRHLRTAISILKDTEDTLRLARAHMFCASVLLWGGRTNGVAGHLARNRRAPRAPAGQLVTAAIDLNIDAITDATDRLFVLIDEAAAQLSCEERETVALRGDPAIATRGRPSPAGAWPYKDAGRLRSGDRPDSCSVRTRRFRHRR